jgi:hypothetical protein
MYVIYIRNFRMEIDVVCHTCEWSMELEAKEVLEESGDARPSSTSGIARPEAVYSSPLAAPVRAPASGTVSIGAFIRLS